MNFRVEFSGSIGQRFRELISGILDFFSKSICSPGKCFGYFRQRFCKPILGILNSFSELCRSFGNFFGHLEQRLGILSAGVIDFVAETISRLNNFLRYRRHRCRKLIPGFLDLFAQALGRLNDFLRDFRHRFGKLLAGTLNFLTELLGGPDKPLGHFACAVFNAHAAAFNEFRDPLSSVAKAFAQRIDGPLHVDGRLLEPLAGISGGIPHLRKRLPCICKRKIHVLGHSADRLVKRADRLVEVHGGFVQRLLHPPHRRIENPGNILEHFLRSRVVPMLLFRLQVGQGLRQGLIESIKRALERLRLLSGDLTEALGEFLDKEVDPMVCPALDAGDRLLEHFVAFGKKKQRRLKVKRRGDF